MRYWFGVFECSQSISPGMVDTDFLSVFRTTPAYAALPKLQPADVTAAVLFALGTPETVQVLLGVLVEHADSFAYMYVVIFIQTHKTTGGGAHVAGGAAIRPAGGGGRLERPIKRLSFCIAMTCLRICRLNKKIISEQISTDILD